MIAANSILRRLPSEIDQKQLLFFDGIRHSADIVTLAYSRLQGTLTEIATTDISMTTESGFTSAFLDAWAVVDAIDRFRSLWRILPGTTRATAASNAPSFDQISQPLRDLRNVADHLAQRMDYIISRGGTALGVLSWYTALRPDGREGFICTIAPGTAQKGRRGQIANPLGRVCEYPTGLIELSAGEYRVCLSEILPHMETRIHDLETSLETALANLGLRGQAGTDVLVRMQVQANDTTTA